MSYVSELAAAILGAAATASRVARIGVRNLIRRLRIRLEPAKEILVLVGLGLREVEGLNLALKLANLRVLILHTELRELIMQRTVVRILVVGDVTSGVGNSRRNRAGVWLESWF